MASYRATLTVKSDGELTLKHLPFRTGEEVRVTVEAASPQQLPQDRFPLRGTPYRYDDPFEPAAGIEDWESGKVYLDLKEIPHDLPF